MKSDGLRLEETQVHEASRLFKLTAIALIAAARTIQLVDARDGSSRPASDVATMISSPPPKRLADTRRQD